MQHPHTRGPAAAAQSRQASLALPTAAADLTQLTFTCHPPGNCAVQLGLTKTGSAGGLEGRLEAQVDGPVSPLLFAGC